MPDTSDDVLEVPEERDEAGSGGRVRRLLAAAALVVLVILIVLVLWKPWRDVSSSADAGRYPGRIVAAEQYPPSETDVTVWLKPGIGIEDVLERHGLPADGLTDLGNGLFVVSAGERSVGSVIEDLRRDDALYDAGRIYEQGSDTATQ
ncbi:MAG: hypothetical protein C0418_02215 [Coriobacteriaceae bacterium]|nr:hypothetical protein [Coriobacteriaceae bacterium]